MVVKRQTVINRINESVNKKWGIIPITNMMMVVAIHLKNNWLKKSLIFNLQCSFACLRMLYPANMLRHKIQIMYNHIGEKFQAKNK